MGINFRKRIQSILAKILFPTTHKDWYKEKGYGKEGKDPFDDFLHQQFSNPESLYCQEFKGLVIKREFIPCLDYRKNTCELDSISFSPNDSQNKPGKGINIVNFFGRLEYYECNFRDMAREAHATGATIHAFNPPGMNSSTGQVNEFKDLVNAGIAQINKLLEKGVHPDKIILQGNCMGAAVAEEVNDHFKKNLGIEFRRINSNSFKSMNALLTYLYPALSFIKDKVKKLLEYTGWQSTPGKLFNETDPYKAYMSRQNDETIKPDAKMRKKIEKMQKKQKEANSEPKPYDTPREWLDQHSEMVLDIAKFSKDKNTNPHELDLYKLKSAKDNTTAFDFINYYIEASNQYVQNHPQQIKDAQIKKGAPYLHKEAPVKVVEETKEQQHEIMKSLEDVIKVTGTDPDQTLSKSDDPNNEQIEFDSPSYI